MRYIYFLILFFCSPGVQTVAAQSVTELESRFNRSGSKQEKMNYAYQIAEKTLASAPKKASDYATRANQLATEIGDKKRETEAALLAAEAEYRQRNYKEANGRYIRAWNTARNYGYRDAAVTSMEKLQDIASKQNDFREALKWSTEIVKYLKDNAGPGARSGGDAQRKLENQLTALEAENRQLKEQLAQATGQTAVLENSYQSQLKDVQEQSQLQIDEKSAAIDQISREKQRADSIVRVNNLRLRNLTQEQMIDSIVKAQQEREIQGQKRREAELRLEKEALQATRNLSFLLFGFAFLLAFLFYLRFRAKRRMANELSVKNSMIETAQRQTDSLLLNILPPAIAEELKARNKVAARRYEQATVMFIDFKGFTRAAEKLTPEQLVEELDHCFSGFDQIISKYNIEKIKTVGDAYICASGLSDKNVNPADMIRAALEIQDFLLALKAERMSQGLPYFEARVGIHAGPVVAGVVGAKKFAYDIWGDTVNTAARMEESCETGRINVSETAYWNSKYEFDWEYRGKLEAKNKGPMEMYYVTGVKRY